MSHRIARPLALAALALVAIFASSRSAVSQGNAGSSSTAIKNEMLANIDGAKDKLVQLAEAMPEAKYGWSPDKGVRTVGDVFMHVAAANFGIPVFVGLKPPAGFEFESYEHSLTKKADIIKALKDSFAHMEGGLKAMSDADMDKPVEFFGMKSTGRGTYLLLLSHAHEHLGQAIAYSRSNKVTPPWTAKEQAAEKEKK